MRFFHRMANPYRRRNCFKSININGKKLDIKEELVDAFRNLLSVPGGWCPLLPDFSLNEIRSEEAARLEETFLEEEIWTAILGQW